MINALTFNYYFFLPGLRSWPRRDLEFCQLPDSSQPGIRGYPPAASIHFSLIATVSLYFHNYTPDLINIIVCSDFRLISQKGREHPGANNSMDNRGPPLTHSGLGHSLLLRRKWMRSTDTVSDHCPFICLLFCTFLIILISDLHVYYLFIIYLCHSNEGS